MADLESQLQQLSEQYSGDTRQYLKSLADDKVNLATDALNKALKSETGFDNTMGMVNMGLIATKGTFDSVNKLKSALSNVRSKGAKNISDIKDNVNESQNTNEEPKTDEPTETEMTDVVGEDVGKDVTEDVGKTVGTEAVEEGAGLGISQLIPGLDVLVDLGAVGSLIYTAVHGVKKAQEAKKEQGKYDEDLKNENEIDSMSMPLVNVSAATKSRQQELSGGISTSD
tara:strand:+ start:1086 stop:1766 length:681 start_codon:yes stop_codon:yes gene_type:complete